MNNIMTCCAVKCVCQQFFVLLHIFIFKTKKIEYYKRCLAESFMCCFFVVVVLYVALVVFCFFIAVVVFMDFLFRFVFCLFVVVFLWL